MKRYRLHWQNGIAEDVEGTSPEDAFNRAGIGAGALSALDYWEELSEPKDEAATAGADAPASLEQALATEEARMKMKDVVFHVTVTVKHMDGPRLEDDSQLVDSVIDAMTSGHVWVDDSEFQIEAELT